MRTSLGVEADEAFDPDYMQALVDFAYQRTLDGETWSDFETLMNSAVAGDL